MPTFCRVLLSPGSKLNPSVLCVHFRIYPNNLLSALSVYISAHLSVSVSGSLYLAHCICLCFCLGLSLSRSLFLNAYNYYIPFSLVLINQHLSFRRIVLTNCDFACSISSVQTCLVWCNYSIRVHTCIHLGAEMGFSSVADHGVEDVLEFCDAEEQSRLWPGCLIPRILIITALGLLPGYIERLERINCSNVESSLIDEQRRSIMSQHVFSYLQLFFTEFDKIAATHNLYRLQWRLLSPLLSHLYI